MRLKQLLCLAALFFSLSNFTFAQTNASSAEQRSAEESTEVKDAKEKARLELEKKAFDTLEKVAAEAEFLKVPENRVYVLTITADALWRKDEKRARRLFTAAAENITAATAGLEVDQSGVPPEWNRISETRNNFLQKVAVRDAELALTLLEQTRPAFLSQILAFMSSGKQPSSQNNQTWLAQQEINFEQQFAVQAAQHNPQRALELARKSLKNGVSYNALDFVETLKTKDLKAANDFADEVLQKLVTTDFTVDNNAPSLAYQLLATQVSQTQQEPQTETTAPHISYDTAKLNQLAAKIADYYSRPNQMDISSIQNILPLVEKFAPASAAGLRRRQNDIKVTISPEQRQQQAQWNKYNELINKAAPEQMIAATDNFTPEQKQQLYQMAAFKFVADNKIEQAFAVVNLLPAGRARDAAFNNLLSQQFSQLASEGKFAEARQIAARAVGKDMQFGFLIRLSVQAAAKDKKAALGFADEARAYVNEQPETSQEMQAFLQLASAYAEIEPSKSFELLESLAPRVNELIGASAIILKFNQNDGGQIFRDNEFVLQYQINNSVLSFDWSRQLRSLAAADFDRTANLADKFERSDVRLMFRLTISQNVLAQITSEEQTDLPIEGRTRNGSPFNTIFFPSVGRISRRK